MKLARGSTNSTQHSVTNISNFLADTHKRTKIDMAEHCTKLTPDNLFYDLKDLHILVLFLESLHVGGVRGAILYYRAPSTV